LVNLNHMRTCTFNGEGTNCGRGIYCTSLEPAQFGTQHAVLLNNCTNRIDLEGQLRFIAACCKDAEFCVPLLVPRQLAVNVQLGTTPEMVHGAGRNVCGEALRKDRDIWVVAETSAAPRTPTASREEDDERPPSGGRRRSTEGLRVSFAADCEECWYHGGERHRWEWIELCCSPWLCLGAWSLLRPSGARWPRSSMSHVVIKRHSQTVE